MQKKQGISLIVLVITIIVMIILAAAVVISLNNNSVIDKASYAVDLTNEQQVQDLAALLWAEAYLDEDRTEPIEDVVKEALSQEGVTEDKWDITVSNTGVVVKVKETKVVISFTIDGVSYQAEEGMTWIKWISSSYNTAEAILTDNKVYIDGKYVTKSEDDDTAELDTNAITSGNAYGLKSEDDTGNEGPHSGGSN